MSQNTYLNFCEFLYHVVSSRCSAFLGRQCNMLCISDFMDDVMFLQWCQWGRIKDDVMFRRVRLVADAEKHDEVGFRQTTHFEPRNA